MSMPTATTSTTTLVEKPESPKLTHSLSLSASRNYNDTHKKGSSWRNKLRAKREPAVAGKEKWRDASLSDKERWKEWHKAKDAERKAGLAAQDRYLGLKANKHTDRQLGMPPTSTGRRADGLGG